MRRTTLWGLCLMSLFPLLYCQKEEVPPPLEIAGTVQDVSEFEGDDGAIDLSVSGGTPPYSFYWSNNDTSQNISGLCAGQYIVTVTDAKAQTAIDTFEVNQPCVIDVDGNMYSIVRIGDQTWMGENLRVTHAPDSSEITSYAYGNDTSLVKTYGRLYTWDAAMNESRLEGAQGICPSGWHVPTDDDFKELEMHLGMTQAEADMADTWRGAPVGTMLKAGGSSGYEAMMSGRRATTGHYYLLGDYEYMWTSKEHGENFAWRRCLTSMTPSRNDKVGRWKTLPKSYGFSVRCVKDD